MDHDQQISAYFDREADRFPLYGEDHRGIGGRILDSLFRRSIRLRFERVMTVCRPVVGQTVLDIGCGTGTYSINFARRRAARVLGIDMAPQMIAVAQQRSVNQGVNTRCSFECVSLTELSISEPFDYVVAMGVLDYVADADAFIDKALTATRRTACFSLPRREGLLAWQRRLRYRQRCPLYMYARDDCARLFENAGASFEIERLARDWFVTVRRER
jgi:SAM-dependent methyltransferase